MEIVLANKLNKKYIKNGIVGVYGDLIDLINDGCDVDGIYYEDEYTVKRFLNGFKLNTKRMNSVLNYLNITGLQLGLLVNFNARKVVPRRIVRFEDYE